MCIDRDSRHEQSVALWLKSSYPGANAAIIAGVPERCSQRREERSIVLWKSVGIGERINRQPDLLFDDLLRFRYFVDQAIPCDPLQVWMAHCM